eukprot:3213070-Pyramimonas_sp.AAC.1
MRCVLARVFQGTAFHSVLGSFGNASIPRSTMRQQSSKIMLGKGNLLVTIYTPVDAGLVIILSWIRLHTPRTQTAT